MPHYHQSLGATPLAQRVFVPNVALGDRTARHRHPAPASMVLRLIVLRLPARRNPPAPCIFAGNRHLIRIGTDDINNGERVNCQTVIGKRITRNRRFVLAKMDNGFTLKLNAQMLSVELSETPQSSHTALPSRVPQTV